MERVASQKEAAMLPGSETTPSSSPPFPNVKLQDWSCGAMLPRLSEIVSGWQEGPNGPQTVVEDGGGEGAKGEGTLTMPAHRRLVVRSRAAPAGPHPYLDRFASGMHRPLEGDDASWREASIQPVPIPDLGHTGIRTKFSPGAGNGFTPDGAMTETFRTDIHDTVRNLSRPTSGDARDMKARDYARATRKHRVDPCGGSLLHAHMSSLELGSGGAGGLLLPTGVLAGGAGPGESLRKSSSLGTFRSRFSPPSSPVSTRRALAGYRRGRSGGGSSDRAGTGNGGDGGRHDSHATTPLDNRHALLHRELSSVKLAAAAMAGGVDSRFAGGGICGGASVPTGASSAGVRSSLTGKGRGCSRYSGKRGAGRSESYEECRRQGSRIRDQGGDRGGGCGGVDNGRLDFDGRLHESSGEKRGGGIGMGEAGTPCEFSGGGADESAWRTDHRERSKRRGRPTESGVGRGGLGGRYVRDVHSGLLQATAADPWSSSSSRERAAPSTSEAAATAKGTSNPSSSPPSSRRELRRMRQPAMKPKSRRTPELQEAFRHLKKPFSADSLLACLLDVRFGNTRDLSPEKPPGKKWDLGALPAGITAPVRAWDGFGESEAEDFDGDGDGVAGRPCGREQPEFPPSDYRSSTRGEGTDDGRDFAIVRDGGGDDSRETMCVEEVLRKTGGGE